MARKRDRGLEALKRSIIAAHSPGNDLAWWVEHDRINIRMTYACAGALRIADPFVLGSVPEPADPCSVRFHVQERGRFASLVGPEVLATLPVLPPPAADHFSVVIVLGGAAHHFELPIPSRANPLTAD